MAMGMIPDRLGWDNRVGRAAVTAQYGGRGNGYVVPVIAKTDFSFDGRAAAGGQDVPLAVGIDSSSWVSGVLVVRVHSRGTWTGTSTLNVIVDSIMLVPEEPDVIFASSSSVANVSITGASPVTVPALVLAAFTPPIGPLLRVRLNYFVSVQGTNPNTISLGVDLVGRPA